MHREELAKTAELARLKLTDAELATFTEQLNRVLEYVAMLDEVDTEDVEPMPHAVDRVNVFREDVPGDSLPREEALAGAPKTDGECFLVPPILEGG